MIEAIRTPSGNLVFALLEVIEPDLESAGSLISSMCFPPDHFLPVR
jgi:hypothetical protein